MMSESTNTAKNTPLQEVLHSKLTQENTQNLQISTMDLKYQQ